MKISLNWVKEFTSVKLSVDELVKKIGAQLGEVEEVINLGERYEGILVAKVVSCEKHPNADKLSVCKIDDGGVNKKVKRDSKGLVQVVCGAPNVRAGITVAWIPPGAIVPSTFDKEQFKLDVRPLRGVDSNGMLASGKELAINDDHDGILILDKPAKPGTPLAEVYDLDDYIIDVENKMFTHRPDCFGILGVAREIAGIQHIKFESPSWYAQPLDVLKQGDKQLKLEVKNEIPDLVPRFMAVPMSGVKVTKSPITMQSYLSRVGIKPINNVVDITNFVMMLTAQPLHAYDYDKVVAQDSASTATLVVRKPKKGEKITLLGGKQIEPRADAMMIASASKLIGVGGVMGGQDTEVDEDTTNIILECANFDMYSIRKTSMEHGLFTDAVTRFNKGQSPMQNDIVLAYAAGMLQKHASAEVAGKIIDTKPDHAKNYWPPTDVTTEFINKRLGLELSTTDIIKLLENVEFRIEADADTLKVAAPFWRTDIEIPEDIVEEVGRLYGYDHLPLELPRRDVTPAAVNSLQQTKQRVRSVLSAAGANEVLTYSFVHGNLMRSVSQNPDQAYQLSNALSPDLQFYRLSLLPSLLDKVHMNVKAGHNEFALFEMNPIHAKNHLDKDNLPLEEQRLSFVYVADEKSAKTKQGAPYYQAKKYVKHLVTDLGLNMKFQPATDYKPKNKTTEALLSPFESKRTAIVTTDDDEFLGVVGEFRSQVRTSLKLPEYAAGFELDLQLLCERRLPKPYYPLPRYPFTEQDISFKVKSSLSYEALHDAVWVELGRASKEHGYSIENMKLTPVDIYRASSKDVHKHITLRIRLSHPERTLTTEETNKLLDEIADYVKTKLGATRI